MSSKETSERSSKANVNVRLDVTTDTIIKTSISSHEAPLPRTHSANVVNPASIEDEQIEPVSAYVEGWRLYMLTIRWVEFSSILFPIQYIYRINTKNLLTRRSVWVSLFLSTFETTIISTALVSITDALHGFESRDWVVTSYLLTYTGTYHPAAHLDKREMFK